MISKYSTNVNELTTFSLCATPKLSTHSQDYTIRNLLLLLINASDVTFFLRLHYHTRRKTMRGYISHATHATIFFTYAPYFPFWTSCTFFCLLQFLWLLRFSYFSSRKNNSFHKRDAETARLARPAARLINDTFVLSYPLMCNAFSDRERVGTHVGVSFLHYFKLLCHIFCIHAIFISEKVLCIWNLCLLHFIAFTLLAVEALRPTHY